jgi:hypothetical protein
MAATIQNAGRLFRIAVASADSITAGEHHGHQQAALVSLVFAVVSLEAFFNESVGLANLCLISGRAFVEGGGNPKSPEPQVVSTFHQLMTDAEDAHMQLESKFVLANWLLTGRAVDRSRQPFQDLAVLVKVRNQLVHFKPNEIFAGPEVTHEILTHSRNPAIKHLRGRNVLADDIAGLTGWSEWISTKAMAKWSCDVVSRVIVDFIGKTPTAGQWGRMLRFWQSTFHLDVTAAVVKSPSPAEQRPDT